MVNIDLLDFRFGDRPETRGILAGEEFFDELSRLFLSYNYGR